MTLGAAVPSKIVLVTPNFENNSLGRTYCLWLLARKLGIKVSVHGVKGRSIWTPLAASAFANDCVIPASDGSDAELTAAAGEADLIVAVKPLPTSFGTALRISQSIGVPLLLDIDDPDIEIRTAWLPWYERAARRILQSRYRRLLELGRLARTVPRIVSNPTLQAMYGGTIIPHVRAMPSPPHYSNSRSPRVRFVGSPRGHKGIDELRSAVSRLSGDGFTLDVTGDAPDDAANWERWLGQTTLEDGARLVGTADVIAIPSLAGSWSPAQLPAKLIDAMSHGRAIVASGTPPIAWALGATGLLVEPGNVDELTGALRRLADPDERRRLGESARLRAEEMFSVTSVAAPFAGALSAAIAARPDRYGNSQASSAVGG